MRTWLALCFIRDRNGWVVTRFQMERRRVGSDTHIRRRMRRVVAVGNTCCARIDPLPVLPSTG